MESRPAWVVLAHLLRPQGRKGELLAELLTDFPERFNDGTQLYLASAGFAGTAAEAKEISVTSHWLPTGRNQGRVVLQLAGVDSISDAERLAGQEVILPADRRLPLEDEANYVSDLIGCTVYDGPTPVGLIEEVQFPTTPDGTRRLEEAAPLLAVASPGGQEILIPFAKAFLVEVNITNKRVDMKLPPGLLEINL